MFIISLMMDAMIGVHAEETDGWFSVGNNDFNGCDTYGTDLDSGYDFVGITTLFLIGGNT